MWRSTVAPGDLVVYPTGTGERTVLSKGPIESTCSWARGSRTASASSRVAAKKAVVRDATSSASAAPEGGHARGTGRGGVVRGRAASPRSGRESHMAGRRPCERNAARSGRAATDGRGRGLEQRRQCSVVARVPQVPARLERVDLQTGVRTSYTSSLRPIALV